MSAIYDEAQFSRSTWDDGIQRSKYVANKEKIFIQKGGRKELRRDKMRQVEVS